MKHCAITGCRNAVAWTWQPNGPDDDMRSGFAFCSPGWHTRGFAAVPVCDEHKAVIQAGNDVQFRYKSTDWWTQGDRLANTSMLVYG